MRSTALSLSQFLDPFSQSVLVGRNDLVISALGLGGCIFEIIRNGLVGGQLYALIFRAAAFGTFRGDLRIC